MIQENALCSGGLVRKGLHNLFRLTLGQCIAFLRYHTSNNSVYAIAGRVAEVRTFPSVCSYVIIRNGKSQLCQHSEAGPKAVLRNGHPGGRSAAG
jgi:hypothetical protein